MSNIDRYIKANREKFDFGELPEGNRDRFLAKLDKAAAAERQKAEERKTGADRRIFTASERTGAIRGRTASGRTMAAWSRSIFIGAASIAAAVAVVFLVGRKGNEGDALQTLEPESSNEYLALLSSLDTEIIELCRKCDDETAEGILKASRKILYETLPLEEQLPEELSDDKRETILKEYYAKKAKGLLRIKDSIACECQ